MPTRTGTYDIQTLLRVEDERIADLDQEALRRTLERDLAIHNQVLLDQLGPLFRTTTEREGASGEHSSVSALHRVGEFGRAPSEVTTGVAKVGWPLLKHQKAVGWTADYLEVATTADFARSFVDARKSDVLRLSREITRALFISTNYTFRDIFVDQVNLGVKRFLNADGDPIPTGPNGEEFDGATETHYFGAAAAWAGSTAQQKADDLQNLVLQLVEKGLASMPVIVINRAQETAVRGLTGTTPAFTEFRDSRIDYVATDKPFQAGDRTRADNRAIGLFDAAVVWTKPWCPAGYIFAYDSDVTERDKPGAFRQPEEPQRQGFRMTPRQNWNPLQMEFIERYFGMGVGNRQNGVVLYTADTSYVNPTIPV